MTIKFGVIGILFRNIKVASPTGNNTFLFKSNFLETKIKFSGLVRKV